VDRPAPLSLLPARICRRLAFLFTDIDDTITEGGMLPSDSYAALWDLWRAGIRIVPVTGRPAGWCDHIARMWPVAGVIGENGAFWYSYDREQRKMTRRDLSGSQPADRDRLLAAARRVLAEVPGTQLAADQAFRVSDVAIDFCEDVPPLPAASVDEICRILAAEGVSFKVSSIHVNFWQGGFDKLSGARAFLEETAGARFEETADRCLFIGDSPNDEPLFAGFPHTIAVANLKRFLPRLSSLPAYITEAESARGFCEAAAAILAVRPSLAPSP
jgi:HAD superfamily hydrolase (TIGR01484 family)